MTTCPARRDSSGNSPQATFHPAPFPSKIATRAGLTAGVAALALMAGGEAKAQDQCGPLGLLGEVVCDVADVDAGVDYTNALGPVDVELLPGANPDGGVNLFSGGNVDLLADLENEITNAGDAGLSVIAVGDVVANIGGVTTTDSDAPAVVLTSINDILFTAGGALNTTGDNSGALEALGQSIDVTLTTADTVGDESIGVDLLAYDGGIDLTADAVRTEGDLSDAVLLDATGPITFDIDTVETQGTEAAGINASVDPTVCATLGDGCSVSGAIGELTTGGFGGIGALIRGAGDVDLGVDVLSTEGDQAAGADIGFDPDACLVLGVGGCDTSFTSGELLTAGDDSTGVLIRGLGDVTADIGVLRTEGDEAAGVDIAGDPDVCVILGAGACDTNVLVGDLATLGDGSPGVLVRGLGDVTADVGALSTEGEDAAGLDLATDPEACILLGDGACDINAFADSVSTEGDGSVGVLIDAAGDVLADIGLVSTEGDNSTAIDIVTDPAACITFGGGSCSVTAQADDVDTDGDDSPGVDVDNDGDNDIDVGDVDTDGDDSPGIDVDGGDGDTTVDAGDVQTDGDDSPGIDVETDGGKITIDVDSVETNGADSDAIHAETDEGDIMVMSGPITTTGPNSDGVDATSTGCGDIMVTLEGDVDVTGAAVRAETCGAVNVTSMPGVDVMAGPVGYDLTSGTGTTVLVGAGGMLMADSGLALNADGAAADITNNGMVMGRIDLTDEDDTFTNNGEFAALGTSDFGDGDDAFTNNGVVSLKGDATFAALETFANDGVIDMRNGNAGDTFTLGGAYAADDDAALLIDIMLGVEGTPADTLVIDGAVTGVTPVTLNPIGPEPGVLNPEGEPIVIAGALSADSFPLTNLPPDDGFVTYSYEVDTAANEARLYALPSAGAYRLAAYPGMATEFWRPSADTWAAHVATLHDGAMPSSPGHAFWASAYFEDRDYDDARAFTVFNSTTTQDLSYSRQSAGAQIGLDMTGEMGVAGVTAGYERAEADFSAANADADIDRFNLGVYAVHGEGEGLHASALAKLDWFIIDAEDPATGYDVEIDGVSYGLRGDVGYRIMMDGWYVEPQVSGDWVMAHIPRFTVLGSEVHYEGVESFEARLGARAGMAGGSGFYASAHWVQQWGQSTTELINAGATAVFDEDADHNWVEGAIGWEGAMGGMSAFAQIEGAAGDVEGLGVRGGLRF